MTTANEIDLTATPAAGASPTGTPGRAIASWSDTERIIEAIRRSKRYLPESLARQLDAFLTPENLAILGGTLVLWAGSHFCGVGEVVDVALLLVGSFVVGWSITGVVRELVAFGAAALGARNEGDLDRAARSFAAAISAGGVTAVFAILLRRSATRLQATRGPALGQVLTPREPGFVAIEPSPPEGGLMRRPTVLGDPSLPAGQGVTTAFGDVRYSTAGSATEQQLARLHELLHSFLSPRLLVFRTFRARLAMSAYARSAILKYLEEALAESFAQIRVNGLSHLLTALRFPVVSGYVTLQQLACEGAEIGKIVFGTERFSVQLVAGPPPAARPK
jgi:hypothetical protein